MSQKMRIPAWAPGTLLQSARNRMASFPRFAWDFHSLLVKVWHSGRPLSPRQTEMVGHLGQEMKEARVLYNSRARGTRMGPAAHIRLHGEGIYVSWDRGLSVQAYPFKCCVTSLNWDVCVCVYMPLPLCALTCTHKYVCRKFLNKDETRKG